MLFTYDSTSFNSFLLCHIRSDRIPACLQAIAIVDPTTQENVKNITTFAGAPLLGPDGKTPRK